MFDVVVDDGADFDRCSNRGANRNHLLSVVCRGGLLASHEARLDSDCMFSWSTNGKMNGGGRSTSSRSGS
jgi:hypothetical protein